MQVLRVNNEIFDAHQGTAYLRTYHILVFKGRFRRLELPAFVDVVAACKRFFHFFGV